MTGGSRRLDGDDGLLGDTELSTILVPDVDGPASNVDEARNDNVERDSSVPLVGDGSLHGREDGTTRDTHDDQGRGSSSVSTESLGRQHEDDRVHDRLEEHDDNGEVDTSLSVDGTDHDRDDGTSDGVDTEQDRSGDDRQEGGSNESSDGESDQTVR